MQVISGVKNSGKSQLSINMLWDALRAGKKCMLFETSMNLDEVKQRLISGNFKDGIKAVEDANNAGKVALEMLESRLHVDDPDIPVSIYCGKYDTADDFLPVFAGRCASLGADAATKPLVFVDYLQDLPWFDGVSSSRSFRHYLEVFQKIEENAGVEIIVSMAMLHTVISPNEPIDKAIKVIAETYPEIMPTKIIYCTGNFTDDIGRRRVHREVYEKPSEDGSED